MIDSKRINQMLLAIELHYSQGNPMSNMEEMSPKERSVFIELAEEVYLMRAKGIAVQLPGEWPEFVDSIFVGAEK